MEQKDFRKILIIYSDFYKDITKNLLMGSEDFLKEMRVTYDKKKVNGSLEIPFLLSKYYKDYSGVIILGCVIKGETDHYQIVKDICFKRIYRFAYDNSIPLGTALLTVNNHEQAQERSDVKRRNLGRNAAVACLNLIKYLKE
ncbi:MAG: 6,7-dimethyl-8-ribityllumazine synthase [Alphaproteobacteria bacterium]|mgnify:CR=1 FL=1